MPTAYINIGSNKGDSLAFIEQAVALIESLCGSTARKAPLFYSEPWGFESDARFVNLGIAIDTILSPVALLQGLQQIERHISPSPHRDSQGGYIDREIDIDIIAIDNLTIDSSQLTIPHPLMHKRDFVLVPLCHLAPDWRHPLLNATATELLALQKK